MYKRFESWNYFHGPNKFPLWRFLSVLVRAFERLCNINHSRKSLKWHFRIHRPNWCQNIGAVFRLWMSSSKVLKYRERYKIQLRTTTKGALVTFKSHSVYIDQTLEKYSTNPGDKESLLPKMPQCVQNTFKKDVKMAAIGQPRAPYRRQVPA